MDIDKNKEHREKRRLSEEDQKNPRSNLGSAPHGDSTH
jgi:hypothetical protein